MKILLANWNSEIVGGVEQYLSGLVPALISRGYEVGAVFEQGPSRSSRTWTDQATRIFPGAMGEHLHREIDAWMPDILVVNGLLSSKTEEKLLEHCPAILFAHNYDGVCISGDRNHSLPFSSACGKRFGYSCLLHYYPRRCGGLNPVVALGLFLQHNRRKNLLPGYAGVITASHYVATIYTTQGVHHSDVHVLPPFPGTEFVLSPRVERVSTTPSRAFTLLFVGRLVKNKGVGELMVAAARVASDLRQPVDVVIAGEGPEEEHLKALAIRLTTGRNLTFTFTGWTRGAELVKMYDCADLLVVPSLWPEPFGIVGLEAAARNLPAVAYDTGGITEWLRDDESGLIVELSAGNQGLAKAITRFVRDPTLRARLRDGALRVAAEFSQDRHIRTFTDLLTATLKSADQYVNTNGTFATASSRTNSVGF